MDAIWFMFGDWICQGQTSRYSITFVKGYQSGHDSLDIGSFFAISGTTHPGQSRRVDRRLLIPGLISAQTDSAHDAYLQAISWEGAAEK